MDRCPAHKCGAPWFLGEDRQRLDGFPVQGHMPAADDPRVAEEDSLRAAVAHVAARVADANRRALYQGDSSGTERGQLSGLWTIQLFEPVCPVLQRSKPGCPASLVPGHVSCGAAWGVAAAPRRQSR